jgi:hypothetical protein
MRRRVSYWLAWGLALLCGEFGADLGLALGHGAHQVGDAVGAVAHHGGNFCVAFALGGGWFAGHGVLLAQNVSVLHEPCGQVGK